MHTRLTAVSRSLLMIAVATILTTPCVNADTIRLKDGRVLDGNIISSTPATAGIVDIQLTSGSYIAILHVPADQIMRIDRGPSPHEQALIDLRAKEQRLADNGSAQEYLQLAQMAAQLDEGTLTRRFASQALVLDPDNTVAHHLLGQVKQNGVWMSPSEAAVARGDVYFRGQWMPRSERDAILSSEQQARQAADEALQERAAERDAQRSYASDDGEGYSNSYGYDYGFANDYGSYGYGGYGYGFGYPIIVLPHGFHHAGHHRRDAGGRWIASNGGAFHGGFGRGNAGGEWRGRR